MNKTTGFLSLSLSLFPLSPLLPSLYLSPPLSDHSLCILMMAEYGFQGAIFDGGRRSGSGWIPGALQSSHARLHLSFTLLDTWNLAGQTDLAGQTGSRWLLAPSVSCTWSGAQTRCGSCGQVKGGVFVRETCQPLPSSLAHPRVCSEALGVENVSSWD